MSDNLISFFDVADFLLKQSKLGKMAVLTYVNVRLLEKHDERLKLDSCATILERYAIDFFAQRANWEEDYNVFISSVVGAVKSSLFAELRAHAWPLGHEGYQSPEQLCKISYDYISDAVFQERSGQPVEVEFAKQIRCCVAEIVLLTV